MAKYTPIHDPNTQYRIDQRYQFEINSLNELGFRHLAYCLEDHGPFSALTKFLIIPLALSEGEILLFQWPFKLSSANVLLSSHNPATIALCMGMGVKLYSNLPDGTMIISSSFFSSAIPGPESRITRLPPQNTIEDTWDSHQKEVLKRRGESHSSPEEIKFEDYVKMSEIEEGKTGYLII